MIRNIASYSVHALKELMIEQNERAIGFLAEFDSMKEEGLREALAVKASNTGKKEDGLRVTEDWAKELLEQYDEVRHELHKVLIRTGDVKLELERRKGMGRKDLMLEGGETGWKTIRWRTQIRLRRLENEEKLWSKAGNVLEHLHGEEVKSVDEFAFETRKYWPTAAKKGEEQKVTRNMYLRKGGSKTTMGRKKNRKKKTVGKKKSRKKKGGRKKHKTRRKKNRKRNTRRN